MLAIFVKETVQSDTIWGLLFTLSRRTLRNLLVA